MTDKKVYAQREVGECEPLTFDAEICNGCNRCVEVCQVDIMIPNPEKGKPPIVLYPSECWYSGDCVTACPREGAIRLNNLLRNRVHWKQKKSI